MINGTAVVKSDSLANYMNHFHSALRLISKTPAGFFATTAFVVGLTLIFLIPPLQSPDETIHYYRAYQVSTLNFAVDDNYNGTYGGQLPVSLGETVDLLSTQPSIFFEWGKKYDTSKTESAMSIPHTQTPVQAYDFTATALAAPVAYLPQAFGIGVARIFDTPPVVGIYAGRIANLLTWIGLVLLSIHLLPFRKWAVAFIGLLPMPLALAASLSPDVTSLGLSLLVLVAPFALIARGKKIQLATLGMLLGLATLLVLCKQLTAILLPLFLIIPTRLFETPKQSYIAKILLLTVPLIVYALWSAQVSGINLESTFSNAQDPPAQIALILSDPRGFLTVMFNTYFFTWGENVFRSVIGTFGWVDTPLAIPIVVIGYIGLLAALFITPPSEEIDDARPTSITRMLVIVLTLVYFIAISAALYVYYSPVAFKVIIGLQGRYFLPLVILAIPLLHGFSAVKTSDNFYRRFIIATTIVLLYCTLVTIHYRYYIVNV